MTQVWLWKVHWDKTDPSAASDAAVKPVSDIKRFNHAVDLIVPAFTHKAEPCSVKSKLPSVVSVTATNGCLYLAVSSLHLQLEVLDSVEVLANMSEC